MGHHAVIVNNFSFWYGDFQALNKLTHLQYPGDEDYGADRTIWLW